MSDFAENTRIINAENQEQLIEARDAEVEKVEKLKFLLNLLKNANLRQVDIPDKEGLQKAIKILRIQDYLRLDDTSSNLDLNECKSVSLTYTERKAMRNYLIRKVSEDCDPIVKFAQKIKEELPDVYGLGDKNKQILELESKRRELQLKLAEVKNKKCAMLKAAADLKMGPYMKNELELMLSEHKLNQMKTSVFQGYILSTLFSPKYTRTEQPVTIKAIKEAEKFVDAALEAEE
ncbi:augmin complex subunit dgt2 [Episyrphus balteatus]|uniref:augmin complex subunit dgt2 n=1 Tax=Episyrphus balteatus TaxID=286459 RepID=UPI00248540A4|nr:augmin complex subunit dgt2 [Episyrphus balteatus]